MLNTILRTSIQYVCVCVCSYISDITLCTLRPIFSEFFLVAILLQYCSDRQTGRLVGPLRCTSLNIHSRNQLSFGLTQHYGQQQTAKTTTTSIAAAATTTNIKHTHFRPLLMCTTIMMIIIMIIMMFEGICYHGKGWSVFTTNQHTHSVLQCYVVVVVVIAALP